MKKRKEADEIYVLDTGSTDNTVEKLKSHGINVKVEEIKPWRFDVARNKSLDLVPLDTDICVCTDLDEVLNSGWRNELEKTWNNANRMRYKYNWALDNNNEPLVTFLYEKIHDRKHYKWVYPVHEVLECDLENEQVSINTNIVLNHYPDKNKSRSSYLPLLELSVEENPENDRNLHYLGREYMYYEKWNEAIDTLERHLNLKSSTWKDERAASMRFIARSYMGLKRTMDAKMWLEKAIEEAPYLRESYLELAFLKYYQKNYTESYHYAHQALSITEKSNSYINEPFAWDYHVYDLLSILSFELHFYEEAFLYAKKALQLNPKDKRIRNNVKLIRNYLKNKKSNE